LYASIFLFLVATAIAVECGSVPTAGCDVTMNTTFNTGFLDCSEESRYCIAIEANEDIYLDCNGSTLYGGDYVTVQMALSGGYHSYLYNCNIEYQSLGIYDDNAIIYLENVTISPITEDTGTALGITGAFDLQIYYSELYGNYGIKTIGDATNGFLAVFSSNITGADLSFYFDEPLELATLDFAYSTIQDGSGATELSYVDGCSFEDSDGVDVNVNFDDSYIHFAPMNYLATFDYSQCITYIPPAEDEGYSPTYRPSDLIAITGDVIGSAGVEFKTLIPLYGFLLILLLLIYLYLKARKSW